MSATQDLQRRSNDYSKALKENRNLQKEMDLHQFKSQVLQEVGEFPGQAEKKCVTDSGQAEASYNYEGSNKRPERRPAPSLLQTRNRM